MSSGEAPANGSPLGLEPGQVRVMPYEARWPALFEQAAARIRARLGDRILGIEHVGSTAVPGLAAKPLIDMLATVPDLARSRALEPDLAALGYELRPKDDIPDRWFFRCFTDGVRTHHLSLAERDSDFCRRTLAFRDALRQHPRLMEEYAALKLELAARYSTDRPAYMDGKTAFVLRVLRDCDIVRDDPGANATREGES